MTGMVFISILRLDIYRPSLVFPPAVLARFHNFLFCTHGLWGFFPLQFDFRFHFTDSFYATSAGMPGKWSPSSKRTLQLWCTSLVHISTLFLVERYFCCFFLFCPHLFNYFLQESGHTRIAFDHAIKQACRSVWEIYQYPSPRLNGRAALPVRASSQAHSLHIPAIHRRLMEC